MKRALIGVASLVLVVGIVVAAVQYLHHRRFRDCQDELAAAVGAGRTYESFLADPRPDGLHRAFQREEVGSLQVMASGWNQKVDEIQSKGARASTTGVFLFGDMVYFLFFDTTGHLQDYVCVAN